MSAHKGQCILLQFDIKLNKSNFVFFGIVQNVLLIKGVV